MDDTKEKLREAVNTLWYSTYTPTDYTRTHELINSVNGKIIKNNKGDYTIEVYFDPELMSSTSNLYGWGEHASFDGSDFRQGLIESIIHGVNGSKNNPRRGESTNVIEVIQQEATQYANSILSKYL